MSIAPEPTLAAPCRDVTDEEVAHYQEKGWVKLKGFIDQRLVAYLLQVARRKMGDDADSNDRPPGGFAYFNSELGYGLSDPSIRALIEHVGPNAKRLMARRAPVGVRYFYDAFIPKLPSSRQSKHGGNGVTSFHQDFISQGVDRSGGMTFWIPLEAYNGEAGTMSFYSGSHRMGVLGDYTTYGDGGLLDAYPEVRDLPLSEQMTYEVGDVTVHCDMTVHGASANLTDKPRWAYSIFVKPADICWTGGPSHNFDKAGLTAWKPFDERLPIIA